MSWQPGNEPQCIKKSHEIALLIRPHNKDWREGRFDRVPGEDAFIPLPD